MPNTPHHPLRSYAIRTAVIASSSAAVALAALLPATGTAPAAPVTSPRAAATAPAPDFTAQVAAALAQPVAAAPVVEAAVEPVAVVAPEAPAAAARRTAMEAALGKLGAPYSWGATGPSSFDCSGLVNWAFDQVGVDLPRTSRALSQAGTPVSRANLQPGDLVFFYRPVSHVGIYIGNGQMVHASTSGKPVMVSSIEGRQFNSARRI